MKELLDDSKASLNAFYSEVLCAVMMLQMQKDLKSSRISIEERFCGFLV
jgi:hypothetical protein